MPSKTEKQRRFFGAVLSAKKGKKSSGKAKEAASGMDIDTIKDFLRKEHVMFPTFETIVESILGHQEETREEVISNARHLADMNFPEFKDTVRILNSENPFLLDKIKDLISFNEEGFKIITLEAFYNHLKMFVGSHLLINRKDS